MLVPRRLPRLLLPIAFACLLSASLGPGRAAAQTVPAPSEVRTPTPRATDVGNPRSTIRPIVERPGFTRAVQQGTRTRSGRPGPRYWQQHAEYRIRARLDPATHRLSGRARITYHNRSPDTLRRVALHLRQNLFRADNPDRGSAPVTGGMSLERVAAGGNALSERAEGAGGPGYRVDGTVAWVSLPAPLPPGGRATLTVEWSFVPPPVPGDGRQGREDGVYFLGYWYPQLAVYDDVSGWVAEAYTGQGEFYMGQADYDVRLTVPRGWVVGATGTLENPSAVLSDRSLRRLATARETGRVVSVLAPRERGAGAATRSGEGPATWHFTAESVRDFAWGTSERYAWDATRALVPPPAGRFGHRAAPAGIEPADRPGPAGPPETVMVHSFYRPTAEAAAWPAAARYTRQAVEALSDYLRPYPYPQMTAMEGVLQSGGMEYPMVTVMQPWADSLKLAGDLMHEVGHMWVPMEVGTNEKRAVWMDEGTTQFNAAQGMRRVHGPEPRAGRPNDSETGQRRIYLRAARAGTEVPLMRHGDRIPPSLYFVLPYNKGAQVLTALRGVLGGPAFRRAMDAFLDRWWGRHPKPADFFNTVADVTGRDLTWFWRTWYYETWTLDQAIASVDRVAGGDSLRVSLASPGRAPMPVLVSVTRADGSTARRRVPVGAWLGRDERHAVVLPDEPAVTRIEIDPHGFFPDVDRTNQVWTR